VTVRLIATDLDGTLVRTDGEISARTRSALAAAEDAGLVVVFVTGRPPDVMKAVSDATGHRGLAVCANGASIYDLHTEEVIEEFPMEAEVARALTTAIREVLPDVAFAVQNGKQFTREPDFRAPFELPPDEIVSELDHLLAGPVVKLLASHHTLNAAELRAETEHVVGELAELLTITFGNPDGGMVELSAAGVTKAFGLERLAGEQSITAAEVMAFGDMPNDIPMLVWAGHAVAVANAHPDVMAVADEVTASNDDDGVALVIERVVASMLKR
jgi:Cof subfamily protein (haloacid dehalogenase superfamily)